MKILYGIENNNVDVTEICYTKLMKDGVIKIKQCDEYRANLFTDPCFRVVKSIFIVNDENSMLKYNHKNDIYIDTKTNKIYTSDAPDSIKELFPDYDSILRNIQSKLKLEFGSFEDEYPEQMMSVRYLTGNEKVLEIGSNIGRNSLIIGYILSQKNNSDFVTLESDLDTANALKYNRDINNMNFNIENAALSKRKLIQKNWSGGTEGHTICSDDLLDGYKEVNTITYNQLCNKYNIEFDTLIFDCEGAFYYILMDMPEILENIKLIIMENDYTDINHKKFIDSVLLENDFYVDYVECGCEIARRKFPDTYNEFFQVWKKKVPENLVINL
jgi:FkbM family methyltransferase